jgi:hypothetical protein
MIEAIHAQNNEICIIDFRPEKTEYSYFLWHVLVLLVCKYLYFCHSFKNYLEKIDATFSYGVRFVSTTT